jgi:hypothetical protein
VTNTDTGASAPIIYGLALNTPAGIVDRFAATLTRYRRRIGSRWRAHDVMLQAVLTFAFLEGGHTYRDLADGNGIPRSTCHTYIQEGIKVLARRALPLTEVIRLAVKAGWPYLIVDGVNIRQVALAYCYARAPSGPCMRIPAHTAQASPNSDAGVLHCRSPCWRRP